MRTYEDPVVVMRREEGVDVAKPVDEEKADLGLDAQALQASIGNDEVQKQDVRDAVEILPQGDPDSDEGREDLLNDEQDGDGHQHQQTNRQPPHLGKKKQTTEKRNTRETRRGGRQEDEQRRRRKRRRRLRL